MAKVDKAEAVRALEPEHALKLLRQMLLIRRFEERAEEQYTRARIGGYCHLAIGEEAANDLARAGEHRAPILGVAERRREPQQIPRAW